VEIDEIDNASVVVVSYELDQLFAEVYLGSAIGFD
jgi:hypothetical protein